MSHGKEAFKAALKDLIWASLDILIDCMQSLTDLLNRWQRLDQNGVYADLRRNQQVGVDQPVEPQQRNEEVSRPSSAPELAKMQRYYGVAIGRKPGIYVSWKDAAEQVIGYSGNVHKAFTNRREAKIFVQQRRRVQ